MSRNGVQAIAIALVLLLLGSGLAGAWIGSTGGPRPDPGLGGFETDPDDFPVQAGGIRVGEAAPVLQDAPSARDFLRVLVLAASILPQ